MLKSEGCLGVNWGKRRGGLEHSRLKEQLCKPPEMGNCLRISEMIKVATAGSRVVGERR